MEADIEAQALVWPAEECANEDEVPGRRYGQEFAQPLDDAEDDRAEEVHGAKGEGAESKAQRKRAGEALPVERGGRRVSVLKTD